MEAYKDIYFAYNVEEASKRMHTHLDKFENPFHRVSCPICSELVVYPIIDTNGGALGQCWHCGHVYAHIRFSPEALLALYELWLPGFLINKRIRDEDWERRPAQNNRDLDIVESYVSNKNAILDIGCAAGDLLVKARERGWKYQIGQDLSMACIEVAKMVGIEVAYGFTFQMDYEPESFDAIVMRHTLEHTPELRFELSKLRDALTPDGILYIIVPRYGGELWEHSLPQHIHHFTVDSLDLVLEVCDYEILFMEEVETSRALVDESMKGIMNNIRVVAKKKKE